MPETPLQNFMNLEDITRALRRQWRIISIITFVFLAGGTAYTLSITPVYQAAATLDIREEQPKQLLLEAELPLGGQVPLEREMLILQSRTIAEEVVSSLKLDYQVTQSPPDIPVHVRELEVGDDLIDQEILISVADGEFEVGLERNHRIASGQLGKQLLTDQVQLLLEGDLSAEGTIRVLRKEFRSAVVELRKNLRVTQRARNVNVVAVKVRDKDPVKASNIANFLSDVYIERNITRLGQEASQTMEVIDNQLGVMRSNLEEGERALNDYKKEQGIFLLNEEATLLIGELSRLEVRSTELDIQLRELTSLQEDLLSGVEGRYLLGTVSDQWPAIQSLVTSLSAQLVELGILRGKYTDSHLQVQTLKRSIAATERQILDAVESTILSVQEQQNSVNEGINEYEMQLQQLPETERQLAALTRRAQVDAELYIFLLQAHEEARIRRASIVSSAHIIDSALVPIAPVLPNRRLNLIIALTLGLVTGFSIAFYIERRMGTVGGIEESEQLFGLPAIGFFPVARTDEELEELTNPTKLVESQSPVAEAARALRTQVQFGRGNLPTWRILLTSPSSGEGKSTVAAGLAVALALAGERTLLIDADLRLPRMHGFFQKPNYRGLTDMILDDIALSEIRIEIIENLDLLTGGKTTNYPAEVLTRPKINELLTKDVEEYRFVLVDTPAGAQFTDAQILAPHVDAVYLVVEPWSSNRAAVNRALSQLWNVGASVRGLIMNRVPMKKDRYGYYSYYRKRRKEKELLEGKRSFWRFLRPGR